MSKIQFIAICTFLTAILSFETVKAQTPIWEGKGRIAISSDGNEHDHDDWAATPLSLALLAASGLQDNLVVYTYSDHIWGSNQDHPSSKSGLNAYQHMRVSVLEGKKWFGFDKTKFICAVDNAEVAYKALTNEINKSSAENPLIIIAAGPMQVVGEAINRAEKSKRQYVSLISHSGWNDNHSDKPHKAFWDKHTGWTFQEIKETFSGDKGGNLKCIHIANQNGREGYEGLKAPREKYDWIKTSQAKNNKAYKKGSWDWLYSRLETCVKKGDFDPSDAGMVIYILTGIEKTAPKLAKEIMENPVVKIKE